jgi:hypothetical protein
MQKKSTPNKSDFIRKHIGLPVEQIVSKAKSEGLRLSPALVYKVRGRTTSAKSVKRAKAPAKAPAKKAAAPASAGAATTSKAAFIRSMPASMSANDVVAAAAKRGMKLTANHVYAVRSTSKPGRPRKAAAKRVSAKPTGRGPGRPSARAGSESTFRRLVLEMGIARAKILVGEVEEKLAALVAGL